MLCRLSIKAVVAQTASEAKKETSGGADSKEKEGLHSLKAPNGFHSRKKETE